MNRSQFLSSGTSEERISLYTAVGSSVRAKRFFRYPEQSAQDVTFDLVELERIPIGESFNVVVNIQVYHFYAAI